MRLSRKLVLPAAAVAVAAVVTVGVVMVVGRDTPEDPRDLSPGELERLALTRFALYQAGESPIRVTVPLDSGTVVITGTVDHQKAEGKGTFRTDGRQDTASHGELLWNRDGLATNTQVGEPRYIPRPFTPAPLDTALHLTVKLAADRPENTQLLARANPRWLRQDHLDGATTDVIQGPRSPNSAGEPRLTYWIDPDNRLRRVHADLLGTTGPVVIDFH